MKNQRILVVDDQQANLVTLERILTREGWVVDKARDGREALDLFREHGPSVIVTDLKMPGMTGLELLKAVRALSSNVEVILMTAFGTVDTAVDAMKYGAWDYVTKPLKRAEIVSSVKKALQRRLLIDENEQLKAKLAENSPVIGDFIGSAPSVKTLMEQVEQVSSTEASILLTGASGTGKGLAAQLIHATSKRNRNKLITVNCAAIPEQLLESELFGHEAGAFTGAIGRKEGRFDLARGGTLFLDEITTMPLPLQAKLLRVLQDREYERVGGTKTLKADVRIISASNIDIDNEVAAGRFREDLFYRLNVIQLRLPSLFERQEDIPLLAFHFLKQFSKKNGRDITTISGEAMTALCNHEWPGNVRELQNCMERAVVLCRTHEIQIEDLPEGIRDFTKVKQRLTFEIGVPLKNVEREVIEATLNHCNGDKHVAASILGITARTLYRRQAEWQSAE
jgi:two-component system, NtrC family, response regulator HydG